MNGHRILLWLCLIVFIFTNDPVLSKKKKQSQDHEKEKYLQSEQGKEGKSFTCHERCGKAFETEEQLAQHIKGVKDHYKDHRCIYSTKSFQTEEKLLQHVNSKNHEVKGTKGNRAKARQAYMDAFLKQIVVDEGDQKQPMALVKDTVDQIIKHIRKQDGGELYLANVRKAGSYAVKGKVGKADEFDTNIPLNVDVEDIRLEGPLKYAYDDKLFKGKKDGPFTKQMNVDKTPEDLSTGSKEIPAGQAAVKVTAKPKLTNLIYNGDLVPYMVQRDFHRRVQKAIDELGMQKTVDLAKVAHGPAITITIRQKEGHQISVDMTPSIPVPQLKVSDYGWPRQKTEYALSKSRINEVLEAGMHLVPKGHELWFISYSKAETALLETIDSGNECRRNTMKVLKRLKQIINSRKSLPGISSYIFQTQLLWSNEKYTEPKYWHQGNFANCVIDMLIDTEEALRKRHLPNYFNPSENILTDKDTTALDNLAAFLEQEKDILMHL